MLLRSFASVCVYLSLPMTVAAADGAAAAGKPPPKPCAGPLVFPSGMAAPGVPGYTYSFPGSRR